MKLKKKQKKALGIIFAVVVGVILILGVTGKLGEILPFALIPGSQIYYPLYSSVCCEVTGPSDWISATTLDSSNYIVNFVCPDTTTQCRTRNPQVTCPGASILAPLGYSVVWQVKIRQPSGFEYNYYDTPIPFLENKIDPQTPQQFQKGGTLSYRSSCINRALIVGGPSILKLFSLAKSPTSNSLDIEHLNTHLVKYPAGEGKFNIFNTPLCNQGASTTNLKMNEPRDAFKFLTEKASDVAESLGLTSKETQSNNQIFLKDAPNQLRVGDCYRSIDKWVTLPAYGNINPKGQYLGNDVMCSPEKGLIKIEEIETIGGTKYYAPTQRLTQPNNFCCNDQDCKYLGMNYNCEYGTYQCKEVARYCITDLDCQPESGIRKDANCYQDDSKFFTWSSTCLSNNRCSTPDTMQVECCPSYCNAFGKVCNFDVGCVDVIPPQPDCPPRQCCQTGNAFNFKVKDCNVGLECCEVSQGVGICKEICEADDEVLDKCGDCGDFAMNKIFGRIWKSKRCKPNLIALPPQTTVTCVFSFIKLALVPIVLIFATLFGFNFFQTAESLKIKNKGIAFLVSLLLAGLLAALVFFLFWVGIIVALLYIIAVVLIKIFL